MVLDLLKIVSLTLVPTLELRASIPFGIFSTNFSWESVYIIAVITNIILGIILYFIMELIVKLMTKVRFIDSLWNRYVERTRDKIHSGVEKYGEWAVAVFIGIPFPGSGVYTGALAAYIIGLDRKKFIIANIIGVLIAATAVTIICLSGSGLIKLFINMRYAN